MEREKEAKRLADYIIANAVLGKRNGGRAAPGGAPPASRGDIGRSLTKDQRKQVLGTLVDVYKAKGAPKEGKGDDRVGYAHSPDLFEKSDITGAMVRYYVTLPDGRIAHPTELFPDYTQGQIDAVMARRADAERTQASADASRLRILRSRIAPDLNEANRIFNKQNFGPLDYVPAILTDGTNFIRTAPEGVSADIALLGNGWRLQGQDSDSAPLASRAQGDLSDTWHAIARNDDAFRYAGSDAKDVVGIARDIDSSMEVTKTADLSSNIESAWYISDPKAAVNGASGTAMLKRYKDGSVELDASDMAEGTGGSRFYHLAATYAYNNGLVFDSDRMGVSDVAVRRRVENLLSSALRFGTTRHIAPGHELTNPTRTNENAPTRLDTMETATGSRLGLIAGGLPGATRASPPRARRTPRSRQR